MYVWQKATLVWMQLYAKTWSRLGLCAAMSPYCIRFVHTNTIAYTVPHQRRYWLQLAAGVHIHTSMSTHTHTRYVHTSAETIAGQMTESAVCKKFLGEERSLVCLLVPKYSLFFQLQSVNWPKRTVFDVFPLGKKKFTKILFPFT